MHLILQSRSYNTLPDWDSSAHLYYAFLKNKKLNFRSSYCFGIKWILPRIYERFENLFKSRLFDHRIVNTFAGFVVLLEFIFLVSSESINNPEIWLFVLILIINSMYVNYQTSSTEFLDTPLIIILILLIQNLPSNYSLALPLLVIIFLGYLFKASNYVYVLPLFGYHFFNLINNPLLFLFLFIILISSLLCLKKIGLKGVNKYSKSRGVFHPKSKRFIMFNPFWVLINILISYFVISQLELLSTLTLVSAWICILSQRVLVGYFWYPIVILNIYFTLKLNLILPKIVLLIGLIVIVRLIISALICIFAPKKYIEPLIRVLNMGELNFSHFKKHDNELRTIKWIKDNMDIKKSIYLWGQKTSIPLLSGLKHIENTFYSHNHLFLWSGVSDVIKYLKFFIITNKPHYIIEAGLVNEINFPAEDYKNYKIIYEEKEIRIFQIK